MLIVFPLTVPNLPSVQFSLLTSSLFSAYFFLTLFGLDKSANFDTPRCSNSHDGSKGLVYLPTFTIEHQPFMWVNIPVPWMICDWKVDFFWNNKIRHLSWGDWGTLTASLVELEAFTRLGRSETNWELPPSYKMNWEYSYRRLIPLILQAVSSLSHFGP